MQHQDGRLAVVEKGLSVKSSGAFVVSADIRPSAFPQGSPLAGAAAVHAISRVLLPLPFSAWTAMVRTDGHADTLAACGIEGQSLIHCGFLRA